MSHLTEIRTVLSRAETAKEAIIQHSYHASYRWDEASWRERHGASGKLMPAWYPREPESLPVDPEWQEACDALDVVIGALEKWRNKKKGRRQ